MAEDGFEIYFAEKIWEMIPAVYRREDGLGDHPGVLRALVEVLARQTAIMRRSHDRLWEDQFIDLCEDWAVSYMGDLLGTRLVSALNLRGRRVDVAKTVYYRRRKGTLAVLEELIGDIVGWEGTVKESFRRLGRAWHRLDPVTSSGSGGFSGTPPGGWADLRHPRAAELTGGPFDEFHYTPDVRRHRGDDGRRNLPKLAFHLYRLNSFAVSGVQPCPISGDNGFTFDPSGRDTPLFAPRGRPPGWASWRQAREWDLPGPILCRSLGHAEFEIDRAIQVLERPGGAVLPALTAAGDLSAWRAPPHGKRLVIDPLRGRFTCSEGLPDNGFAVRYHYGFSGDIGSGTYHRPAAEARTPDLNLSGGGEISDGGWAEPAIVQVDDSATYGPIESLSSVQNLTVQAANRQRPYLCLDEDLILAAADAGDAILTLDGLWIGTQSGTPVSVVLQGDFERVTLQHMTMDPGGPRQDEPIAEHLQAVHLVIEGHVEQLTIESSITGPVSTRNGGVVEALVIRDTVVQSQEPSVPALLLGGVVTTQRVTVLGTLNVHRLWAVDTLIDGMAQVVDTQNGCFRFSAAQVGSRLPKPYEPCWVAVGAVLFTSRRFGHPGYAQLSTAAPEALRRGAENGSEIGAFSALLNPVKFDGLRAKVDEYMPFGLIPIYIYET